MKDKNKEFGTQPSFVGDKIFLRAVTVDDIANFHLWLLQNEPQTRSCRPYPIQSAAEATEAFRKREPSTNREFFAIVRKKDKVPVGKISYFDYNSLNRSAELGLLIDPDEQKKGHGNEAIRLLVKYLFRQRGFNKVYAQTAAFNKGAIKLLESLKFSKDATLRDHYFHDGEFHKGLIYSLLLYEFDW
ncbi:MAG: GNAT family N-acetyltransferase [candidate division Zixibacteria bacterium]|nr:GNAT family N-acetyltransferase [candidate division Zixibacteria bacterium]